MCGVRSPEAVGILLVVGDRALTSDADMGTIVMITVIFFLIYSRLLPHSILLAHAFSFASSFIVWCSHRGMQVVSDAQCI